MTYYVGIDLGGTNIKAGIVDEKGTLLNKDSIKTMAERPMEEIITDMGKLALKVIEDAGLTPDQIDSIGIGSPGTPDNEAGVLVYSNNLPFNMAPSSEALLIFLFISTMMQTAQAWLRQLQVLPRAQRTP